MERESVRVKGWGGGRKRWRKKKRRG